MAMTSTISSMGTSVRSVRSGDVDMTATRLSVILYDAHSPRPMAEMVSGSHTRVQDIATLAMISPRAGGPSYTISSAPQFAPAGSSTEPTTVKSATPFRRCPLGGALGAGVSSPAALAAGSTGARFERLPRRTPRRDSKSSSSAGASAEDSSARARTERRAG